MKRILLAAIPFAFLPATLFAQATTVQTLTDKGNTLFDDGKYIDAIVEYQHALYIDSNAPGPNLEMANTYLALKKYQKAIDYCDKIIRLNTSCVDQAYMDKGSALDMMNELDAAIQTYKEGIKKYPDNYLLLYNAAFTYFRVNKFDEAAYYSARAVSANPKHASSHLMLANSMYQLRKRPQSVMALYYFLLLEPNSKRSVGALQLLNRQRQAGVSKEGENKIAINIPEKDVHDEFGTVDMIHSCVQALKDGDKNKDKTEEQLFYENTELLFKALDETKEKDRSKSVWWETYIPVFHDLLLSENTEAFCYSICAPQNNDLVDKWLTGHKDEVEKFAKWREKYAPGGRQGIMFK